MELCTRRVPRQTWVRVGVCRRTPDFEPGHNWLYADSVRRDAWVIGPLAGYLMRMPVNPPEITEAYGIRMTLFWTWARFGWPRWCAEFSSWARGLRQGSRIRRWVARREGWGYDDQLARDDERV